MENKYKSAQSFLDALKEKQRKIVSDTGYTANRVRTIIAFERVLARIFESNHKWVLKGGFAMELRVSNPRTTKDIDLAIREESLLKSNTEETNKALHELLIEIAFIDLNDFFKFTVGSPVMDIEAAPYGGARFPVEAKVNGRSFSKFSLDVAIGDAIINPTEELKGYNWLSFMGLETPKFMALSKEQQFSEKIHAYTLPRPTPNSRVKDLVDMVLLIEQGLDKNFLSKAMKTVFSIRGTHKLTTDLDSPPESWEDRFNNLAEECEINMKMNEAFIKISSFLQDLRIE